MGVRRRKFGIHMGQRGLITVFAAVGVVAALSAGTAVAVASSERNGTTEAGTSNVEPPRPFSESNLPTDEPAVRDDGSIEQRALPVSAKKKLKRTFQIKTKDPVFFITIDDGNTKSDAALKYVTRKQIPATVFLTNASVAGQWDYFRKFAAQGGTVENHTMTHRSLTSSGTPLSYEICRPQGIYGAHYKRVPTLLRPPYGNGGYAGTKASTRKAIDSVASKCGIKHVVMWNALAENGKFQFIRGSLKRGDIVLFHFTPSLAGELKAVMKMAHQRGLHPAPLTDYLK